MEKMILEAKIEDQIVRLFDASNGRLKRTISCSNYKGAKSVEIYGSRVVISCGDEKVRIYDIAEGSGVANVLSFIAFIELIFTPFVCLPLFRQEDASLGWIILLTGIISGLILLGFSKAIEYLCESMQRLREIEFLLRINVK